MKRTLYSSMAWGSIKKNYRLYIPYILTCVGMVMMTYIVGYLAKSPFLNMVGGGGTMRGFMQFGFFIIAAFSLIFLFYTNAFLIRRRKKEFGLYYILGMNKRNIGRVLLWETLYIAFFAFAGGLFLGVSLSKLAEIAMLKATNSEVVAKFYISKEAAGFTVLWFAGIFVLLYLNTRLQVHRSQGVALLKSEQTGEKKPKANWLLGIAGAVILGAAYYIAVTIDNPVSALSLFFVAVLMVIAATYLLMIAGSVVMCRLLQKNKGYYYNPKHFVSVSSMAYRMKRNGAGLASICILATMVLVMLSTTVCLYVGTEDSLKERYPREWNISIYNRENLQSVSTEPYQEMYRELLNEAERICREYQGNISDMYSFEYLETFGMIEGNEFDAQADFQSAYSGLDFTNLKQLSIISLEDYNRTMGTDETLEDGEALLYTYRTKYTEPALTLKNGDSFKIKKQLSEFTVTGEAAMNIIPTIYLVVPDLKNSLSHSLNLTLADGQNAFAYSWEAGFDTGLSDEDQIKGLKEAYNSLTDMIGDQEIPVESFDMEGRTAVRQSFYEVYGSLLFLGIMLSIVFLIAAVLIIYYKQISEGYEDAGRFSIMRKVGMSRKMIRSSINSQLSTVFYLPLAGAGIHLCFAFPMIQKMLLLFGMTNTKLFVLACLISFIIFGIFYTIVYRITSNAYYHIVSGAK